METRLLCEWVRELREVTLCVTRQEFADQLGVCEASVRNWETGKSIPIPLHLLALEDVAQSVGYPVAFVREKPERRTGQVWRYAKSKEEPHDDDEY